MIRWIIEDQLGTAPKDELGAAEGLIVLDVRELVDMGGNDAGHIRKMLEEGRAALVSGARLIVACDFGVSRSNAVAAGILALWRGLQLDSAIEQVMAATGEASIKVSVVESVRRALDDDMSKPEGAGTILVTGATGFLGRHLVAALVGKVDVVAPTRGELDLLGSAVALTRYCREHGVRRVVHLAAPTVYTNITSMGQSLQMLRGLIDVCLALGASLLHVSGAVVFSGYDAAPLHAGLGTPARPKHIYGETKYLEECLVDAVAASSRLEMVSVRLAPVYGPGGNRPRFIRKFSEGLLAGHTIKTHRYRNGPPKLELTYIDDAVDALRRIILRDCRGRVHIGTGCLYSPAEVATEIAAIFGRPLVHEEIAIDETTALVTLGFAAVDRELTWAPTIPLRLGLERTLAG